MVIKHDGGSTLTSTAKGARIRGLNFVHTGGNTAGRGRQGPRCLEVCEGFLTVDNCTFSSLAGSAVMVVGPGSALLRRTGLVNSGRCGLICVHEGNAECVGCNLSGNALNGTDVQSGGCVSMRESIVRRNNQASDQTLPNAICRALRGGWCRRRDEVVGLQQHPMPWKY